MWTVIYVTHSAKVAEKIKDRLTEEGFFVKIRQAKVGKQYEILVPQSELPEVQEILSSILQ